MLVSTAMNKKPSIHKIQTTASSHIFQIEAIDLEFSNGEKRQYERLASRGHGAVLIVPILNKATFLLIREYCVGKECYELGFPKGKVDAGEAILEAANRELMEEVGYEAAQLTVLKKISLAPTYMAHQTHLVLAQNLSPHREVGDEPEPLEVVEWQWSELDQLLAREDFTEARSIAALFLAREQLNK